MASTQPKLQQVLKTILGSNNVYFQPPTSAQMHYPAIKYKRRYITGEHADDLFYKYKYCYEVIVIDRNPDNPTVEKLLTTLEYCSYDRHYEADNLHHDVLTLYY